MILKQRFTNGSEQNTELGRTYKVIEKNKNPQGFEETGEGYYSNWPEAKKHYEIEAFLIYNEGRPYGYDTMPIFRGMYNAVMSNDGSIYQVFTTFADVPATQETPGKSKEQYIIEAMDEMCTESLYPEAGDKWDEVRKEVCRVRKIEIPKLPHEREPTLQELQGIIHKMDYYKLESGFMALDSSGKFVFFEERPAFYSKPITRPEVLKMIDNC